MRHIAAGVLLLLVVAACGSPIEPRAPGDDLPPGGPGAGDNGAPPGDTAPPELLAEGENPGFCVEGPSFAVAGDAEGWAEIERRHGECQPEPVPVPSVDFAAAIGVAAWWAVTPCLGYEIRTRSVERDGDDIIVTAETSSPEGDFCATALGGLESFYALDRSDAAGATQVRFVLDGEDVGVEPLP